MDGMVRLVRNPLDNIAANVGHIQKMKAARRAANWKAAGKHKAHEEQSTW